MNDEQIETMFDAISGMIADASITDETGFQLSAKQRAWFRKLDNYKRQVKEGFKLIPPRPKPEPEPPKPAAVKQEPPKPPAATPQNNNGAASTLPVRTK